MRRKYCVQEILRANVATCDWDCLEVEAVDVEGWELYGLSTCGREEGSGERSVRDSQMS